MSETKTRNFNNFNELKEIVADTPDAGLIVVLTSKGKENPAVAQLVAHNLSNNKNGLTDTFAVLDGTESIQAIRQQCLTEYDEFGRPGAILIDESHHDDVILPQEAAGRLALLAKELGIKVTLLTYNLAPFVEQDANLIVKVNATTGSNHSLDVLKNRHGNTSTVEFTYEDPSV